MIYTKHKGSRAICCARPFVTFAATPNAFQHNARQLRFTLHVSFYRHALRQVARLIHVGAAADGDLVGQAL